MILPNWLQRIKQFSWIDLGTGSTRHWTKGKLIGFDYARRHASGGKTALDLGCGDGFWSERLKGIGYQVTSIDHDKYYDQTQVVDLHGGLPFLDQSFDLIWSTEVLEHLVSPSGLIQEIKRTLKPNGLLILTTPNSHFWLYAVLGLFGYTPRDVQNPDHKQFFHLSDILRLLPEASVYGFFPYFLFKFTLVNRRLISWLSPTFTVTQRLTQG